LKFVQKTKFSFQSVANRTDFFIGRDEVIRKALKASIKDLRMMTADDANDQALPDKQIAMSVRRIFLR
jgi:hypothetical protein